jgi:hypothetical protein
MKPADPLGGLLPPPPPARDLPDRDRHRRELLAAVRVGPAARFRAGAAGWLAPLGAALAVAVILVGVFVLPGLLGGARHTGPGTVTASAHPAAGGGHAPGSWHRRSENYLVSTAVRTLVIHDGVGSVSVTGQARSTVSASAHLAYRGGVPVVGHLVRRGALELFYRCDTGSTCRVSFDVAVPRAVNVIVVSAVGQIQLAGLTGTVKAYTATGPIQAGALSVRQAQLTTGTGSITAGFMVPPRRIAAAAEVGSVTIRVPASARYQVAASAQTGSVAVAVARTASPGHIIKASTGVGTITIANG